MYIKNNYQHRNKYLVIGRDKSYFVKKTLILPKSSLKLSDIIKMIEILIDNIFVMFGGQSAYLWVQTASLLADLFLYSYEADFIQGLLKKKRKEASPILSCNILFRYIDDVLSLNNSRFGDFVHRIPLSLK